MTRSWSASKGAYLRYTACDSYSDNYLIVFELHLLRPHAPTTPKQLHIHPCEADSGIVGGINMPTNDSSKTFPGSGVLKQTRQFTTVSRHLHCEL